MRKREKTLWGYGALALGAVLLARPTTGPTPKVTPKPPRAGSTTGSTAPTERQGDVISYFFDPGLGAIVVKTPESPDVAWGAPMLKDDKLPKLKNMLVQWKPLIDDVGVEFHIPSNEIGAIMWAESGGNQNATSPKGAEGLLQVMPMHFAAGATKAQMRDPRTNVRTGAKLLSASRNKGHDLVQMASWYNAGGSGGDPWTNASWLKAGRNPALTTRWGFPAEPSYIDTVVAAFNSLQALERAS